MKQNVFSFRTLILSLLTLLFTQVGWSQPWTYDYGTGTGTFNTSNTASTTFITGVSTTPANGGTYRVRMGNAVGGSFVITNPGTSLGTLSELQINASSSTSTNKFGVYDWTSTSTVSYLKAKVRTTSSGNGNLVVALGVNTIANDGQGFTSHYNNSLAQVRFTYTSGALSVTRRTSGADNTISSSGFSKDADQVIEIYANNGSASASYVRGGASYSLTTRTWDLWVDGTRKVTGAATAGTLAAGTALSGFSFFAESSSGNAAIIYIDDIEYSNTLPAPTISSSGTLSAVNTTYGSASTSPSSFSVSGANMTAGISVTPPAGFEVSTTSDFSSSVGDNSTILTVGSSGTIASTTVYVRLKASATVAGSPYSGNIVLSSTGATNVNVATASSTVSTKSLSVTGLTGDNKTYNGSTSATATGTAELSGVLSGDASNVSLGGTPVYTFASSSVGSAISISTTGYSISGSASGNYSLTQPALSADITTKSLTVTANDVSKTAGVAITGGSGSTAFTSSGLENSETIGSVTIVYGTAGAATGDGATPGVYANQVTPSAATGGAFNSSNYNITYSAGSITVNAAPSNPTISTTGALSAVSTTYGTASASPTSFSVSGTALTDDILVTPPSGFEVSSGSGYSTSLTLTQSGGTVASTTIYVRLAATASVAGSPYSGNVVISSTGATSQNVATVSSTVTAKALTITGITGSNKEYDRTTSASFSGTAAYSGMVNSESFSVSGTPTASFANATVGTNKTITISGYTAPSGNYSLTQPSLLGDITAKALTISSAAASNKTYDGNTNATITGSLSGVIGADVVSFSGTGTFATSNAGTGISVTSTATLTGADAGNYSLTQPTGLTAEINKAIQSIAFNALPAKTTADADFAPGATSATSGVNAITYSSSNTAVATIVSGNIHIVGAGTSTITASQAGSVNYNAAADVNQTLTVTPAITTVAAWNFTGISSPATATATTFNANLVSTSPASDITRGAGAAASTGNNSFRTTGFQNNGISTANTDYFQVTIGAKSGYKLSLRTIDARFVGTATFVASPGVTSQFAYSLDGTNFTLIGSAVQATTLTMTQIDLSGVSALQNVAGGTTVTIRYYASGQTTTGGWGFNSPTSSDNGLAFGGFVEALPASPTLTAASSATVDNDFNITFSDDATWRAAVTAVKYGSTTLSSSTDYTLSSGALTLKPSGSAGSGLRTPGTQTVTIVATNYSDATVSQTIGAGAATKLLIATQPTAPLNNGEVLATQPIVRIADQYDNTTSSTATVDASVGSGTWTLGGTSSSAAVSGTATFTNLTASSAAAVTDATISFTSSGLTGVTSSTFNIPAPPTGEPSEHPTSFASALGTPSYSTINLTWSDAGGSIAPDGYLIKGSTASYGSITDPVDGTPEANGGLNKNITQGVQAASFTGLSGSTTYYFKIYSYTNAGSLINYKLDGVIQQTSSTTTRSTSPTDYFRSKASGNLNANSTWESSLDNSTWNSASLAPTSAAASVTILNGHTVTVTASATISNLVINSGGAATINASTTLSIGDGAGTDLTVSGTLTNSGTLTIASGSAASFLSGSVYNHNTNGGVIPTATWDVSSTCVISGMTSTRPTGFGQTFGNFTWNNSGQTTFLNINSASFGVSGKLLVNASNTSNLALVGSTATNYNYDIGSIEVSGGTLNFNFVSTSSGGLATINVGGDITVSGSGALNIVAGSGNPASPSYMTTVNLSGNLIVGPNANFTATAAAANAYGKINFNNLSAVQTASFGSGSGTRGKFDVDIISGSTLQLLSNFPMSSRSSSDVDYFDVHGILKTGGYSITQGALGSHAAFELYSGAQFESSNSGGLNSEVAVGGEKLFDAGAKYVFNGATTSAFPTTVQLSSFGNPARIDVNADITITRDLTISSTLNLNSGTLSDNGYTITNQGNITGSGTHSGSGKIVMTGSAKTISGATLGNLELNNADGFSLIGSPTISVLTFAAGKLTLGNYDASITGSISGQSSSSYVVTNGSGALKRSVSAAGDYVFPVGNVTNYEEAIVSFASALSASNTLAARFVTGQAGTSGLPLGSIIGVSSYGYWQINAASSIAEPYSLTLKANNFAGLNGFNSTKIIKRSNSSSSWALDGTASTTTGSNSAAVLTTSGLIGFSEFGVGMTLSEGSTLPVTLLSFSGYKDGVRNQLRWITVTETNNAGFQVERSADGLTYQSIGFVSSQAIGGNSQAQLKYSFTDANPAGIKHYYRLRQVDIDGRSSLSNILLLQGEKPTTFEIASVFPNPTRGQITMLLSAPTNETVNIRVMDLTGRIVETRQVNVLTGNNSIPFDLSKQAKGQYLIQVGEKVVRVVRE